MSRQLQRRLWVYNHGNRRVESGSRPAKILQTLYPYNKKSSAELGGSSTKLTRSRLKKRGLLTQDEDGAYTLTDLGRWFTTSSILNLSFLQLCALACACCTQQRYASAKKTGFYMRSTFEGIFKEYYSKRYITWIFATLKRNGYAEKFAKRMIRIKPEICAGLMSRYGEQFKRLESWLDSLEEKELEILAKALDGFEPTEEQRD